MPTRLTWVTSSRSKGSVLVEEEIPLSKEVLKHVVWEVEREFKKGKKRRRKVRRMADRLAEAWGARRR